MTSKKLREAVYRTPFVPVRLALDAGDPIEVRHPEHIFIGKGWVGVAMDPHAPAIFEPWRVVSVTYLENGGHRKR